MPLVLMHATAAGPDYILESGKIYKLNSDLAKRFTTEKHPTDKNHYASIFDPSKLGTPKNPAVKDSAVWKLTPIPATPDPEEHKQEELDEMAFAEDDAA